MRVYHYTKADIALKIIAERQLKVSRYAELNDPFEMAQFASSDAKIRKVLLKVKDGMSKYFGIICFSETWKSIPMWAHYADNHQGVCLGFDIPNQTSDTGGLCKIKYCDIRLEFDADRFSSEREEWKLENQDFFLQKSQQWEYEQEMRLQIKLDPAEENYAGHYFYPFSDTCKLAEVIVGASSGVTREQAEKAIGDLSGGIIQKKVRSAFKNFKMVEQKNKRFWK